MKRVTLTILIIIATTITTKVVHGETSSSRDGYVCSKVETQKCSEAILDKPLERYTIQDRQSLTFPKVKMEVVGTQEHSAVSKDICLEGFT